MNVFATEFSPFRAAEALDDVRLRKMLIETTQLLCTVIRLENEANNKKADEKGLYKKTHVHHPLVAWAQIPEHWMWLRAYGMALNFECFTRFQKVYKTADVLSRVFYPFKEDFDEDKPIIFMNCARNRSLDLDFTELPTFEAYRRYLNARWATDKRLPKWTNREPPAWREAT